MEGNGMSRGEHSCWGKILILSMSMCELKYIIPSNSNIMETKNFSKHHINKTTQEHQILCGKPSSIKGKTMGQFR